MDRQLNDKPGRKEAAKTFMNMSENIVGIAAILNLFGFTHKFVPQNGDMPAYFIGDDPVTCTSLIFWYDMTDEKVRETIAKSRRAFGV